MMQLSRLGIQLLVPGTRRGVIRRANVSRTRRDPLQLLRPKSNVSYFDLPTSWLPLPTGGRRDRAYARAEREPSRLDAAETPGVGIAGFLLQILTNYVLPNSARSPGQIPRPTRFQLDGIFVRRRQKRPVLERPVARPASGAAPTISFSDEFRLRTRRREESERLQAS